MSYAELKELFKDETYDAILSDLYRRGSKCGVDGLRVISEKQLSNAVSRLSDRIVTEFDLTNYAYGGFSLFRTPEFRQLVVSKKSE